MAGIAASTLAGNARLPVRAFLIEGAKRATGFGDGRPRFVGSREAGDDAAGGNRHLALVSGIAFRHAETAGLFGRRGGVRRRLGLPLVGNKAPCEDTAEQ